MGNELAYYSFYHFSYRLQSLPWRPLRVYFIKCFFDQLLPLRVFDVYDEHASHLFEASQHLDWIPFQYFQCQSIVIWALHWVENGHMTWNGQKVLKFQSRVNLAETIFCSNIPYCVWLAAFHRMAGLANVFKTLISGSWRLWRWSAPTTRRNCGPTWCRSVN